MTLADRLVVLSAGRIEQIGRPLDVYHRPATTFVASFIGSPAMNLVNGELHGSKLALGSALIDLGATVPTQGAMTVGLRAEDLRIHNGTEGSLPFRIDY